MKYASLIRLALTIALGLGMAFVEGADPFDLSRYEVRNRCTNVCASLIELTGATPASAGQPHATMSEIQPAAGEGPVPIALNAAIG